MISSTECDRRVRIGTPLLAALTLLLIGCSPEASSDNPIQPPLAVAAGLALSDTAAAPGDTIAVMVLGSRSDSGALAMVQGTLRFDPGALRYLGQPLAGNAIVLVGDTGIDHGTLRSISVRMAGLEGPIADLRFEVRHRSYTKSLQWGLELAGTSDIQLTSKAAPLPIRILPAPPGPPPRRLTAIDWAVYFGWDTLELRVKPLSAGDGTVYGDITLNGHIDGLDVLAVANMSVGNRQLLTDATKDYVIAGNVFPANLPGLGESIDPVPPGQESDGSFIINGGDVLTIANENVGNNRPIAGELIPGKQPGPINRAVITGDLTADRTLFRDTVYELQGSVSVLGGVHLTIEPGTRIEGDAISRGALAIQRGGRIFATGTRLEPIVFTINGGDVLTIANENVGNNRPIAGELIPGKQPGPINRAVITGDLTADRTLFRDTVYELQGSVSVLGGVHLTIEPGTRIEGDAISRGALAIQRGGRIFATGTRLEPIVFTCNAATKTPGCWGGLVLNGFSLLNNDQTGNPIIGCPEKPSIGNPGVYGGCLVQDTSGTLRYVRVEYGGMPLSSGGPVTPSLALLGAGSGTVIENVQVHGSAGDGLFVSGGTTNLRYMALTANGMAGLGWEDGWVGNGQFIYIQQGMGGGDGLRGLNWALNANAGPRSAPKLYNLTLTSGGPGATGHRGLVFDFGSGATIRNSIVFGSGAAGLDIDGQASCDQTTGTNPTLLIENTIFFGNAPDFDPDPDCIDEAAYGTAAARANRTVDPGLIAISNTLTPDLRPLLGSAATAGFVLPPPNTFFAPMALYLGAVAPSNALGTNVPWYAGWTRGFAGVP